MTSGREDIEGADHPTERSAIARENVERDLLRAQDDLQRQSEWRRIVWSSIDDAVVSTDAEGRVTSFNPAAEQILGWRQEEATGLPLSQILQLIDETTGAELPNPADQALLSSPPEPGRRAPRVALPANAVLVGRDGTRHPIAGSSGPMRDASGNVVGAALVFRDVGARLDARLFQGRLAAIVESSQDAIISKNLKGIIQSWNQGAERLFGFTEAEAVGCSIDIIIPRERRDEERSIIQRLRQGERIEHFDTERLTKSGDRVHISVTISPILDAEGRPIGASKVARDITLRKRAEDLLREAQRRKDEFLPLLAHELRNPLAPLKNGLEILRLAGDDRGLADEARAMMERQLSHLVRLVDDLLDVSRISRNKMELRRAPVRLVEVVRNAVEAARPALDVAGHRFSVSLPDEDLLLDADLTRLAQVFGNLLSNSIKYTPSGGHITLTAARHADDVVVSLSDDGIGIPPEALPRIFDMFSQVDRSIERATGGLGIGLALVRGLVEMHGGSVTATSRGAGSGSTFTVRLPLLVQQPAGTALPDLGGRLAARPSAPTGRPARRILVVDDNVDAANSMATMLRLLGNDVRRVHDGLQAIALTAEFRPDVVLMDLGMPGLNGYDAILRLRELPDGKNLKIIAVTGWGQDSDRAKSRAAGFDGHLVKPAQLADLERLLGDLTAHRI
jgi:PAS domain S-box-containing protein